jgi:vacuolar-type H+-ATPase subunit D/Vma8
MINKISEEHLTELSGLVNSLKSMREKFTNLSMGLFNLEEQRDTVMMDIRQTEDAMDKMREVLTEAYGDVNIDLTDGTIIPNETTEE